jgi:hypothetical protein
MPSATPDTVTRYIGNCQICEGDFKLTPQKTMVHHGYERPGWGHIHGDCMGVHAEPYETSCERLKSFRDGLRERLASNVERLRQLDAGEITDLSVTSLRGYGHNARVITHCYSIGVTPVHVWLDVLRYEKSSVEMELRNLKAGIERCEKRIAAWTPKPIRTVEEAAAEEKGAKDARKSEREAARAEKRRKAAELERKRQEREAERQKVIASFAEKFRALASKPGPVESRRREAYELLAEMKRPKHRKFGDFYSTELKCDEAFVTLGLAERGDGSIGNGWKTYPY